MECIGRQLEAEPVGRVHIWTMNMSGPLSDALVELCKILGWFEE